MSGRFAGLKQAASVQVVPQAEVQDPATTATPKGREGKKLVGGWFSPELNRALRQMALNEGKTVQALIGEAADLLMRSRDQHPFGER